MPKSIEHLRALKQLSIYDSMGVLAMSVPQGVDDIVTRTPSVSFAAPADSPIAEHLRFGTNRANKIENQGAWSPAILF